MIDEVDRDVSWLFGVHGSAPDCYGKKKLIDNGSGAAVRQPCLRRKQTAR